MWSLRKGKTVKWKINYKRKGKEPTKERHKTEREKCKSKE